VVQAALANDACLLHARSLDASDAAVAAAECKLAALEAKLGAEAATASSHILTLEKEVQALNARLQLVGNVGNPASGADRKVRFQRIVDRLDANLDDHYIGVDLDVTDQDRMDAAELRDQELEVLRERELQLVRTVASHEDRLRTIADLLEADPDDYYLGLDNDEEQDPGDSSAGPANVAESDPDDSSVGPASDGEAVIADIEPEVDVDVVVVALKSRTIPAADAGHPRMSAACGRRIVHMVWDDLRPAALLRACHGPSAALQKAGGGGAGATC
jgi:hypothetical protein